MSRVDVEQGSKEKENKQQDEGSKKDEERRNALMVVASLMAAMAFQAGLTPPGGLWQDDSKSQSTTVAPSEAAASEKHEAGYPILFDKDGTSYDTYIAFNTTAYMASLSIILLLVSGLPFSTKKSFVAILTMVIWVAITAMGGTYVITIVALTNSSAAFSASSMVLYVWGGLLVILILGHMIQFLEWIIKKLRGCCGLCARRRL